MSCPFTIKSCKYCPVETCGERETEKAYTTIAPNTLTEQAGVKMNKSIFEQKVEWIIKTPFYNRSVTDALVKAVSEELLELAKIEICKDCPVSYMKSIEETIKNLHKAYHLEKASKNLEKCIEDFKTKQEEKK